MGAENTGKKRGYHHGNLRPALIEAAIELIDELGIQALTLRELAGRVGVTHAAPYRHFRDKSTLLHAVAQEGFRGLASRLSEAAIEPAAQASTPSASLRRVARAYLDYAAERPALYRLMFASAPDVATAVGAPGDELRRAVLAELERGVRLMQPPSSPPAADVRTLAVVLWAELHGLASLRLEQHLPLSGAAPERGLSALLDAVVQTLLPGLAGQDDRS